MSQAVMTPRKHKVSRHNNLLVVAGNANRPLAEKICRHMNKPLGDLFVGRFSEGEIQVKINEDVRGKDVFVVQPTCPPVNENLVELLIILDALRRSSARRITAVIPYYGYARQDRKDQSRVPITAKLVANLITVAGANRGLAMDLHAGQIQGFFDIPLDHLYAAPVFIDYLRKKKLKDFVIVSPDVGGVKMARAFAKRLGAGLAIVDKRRIDDRQTEVMHVIGDVAGKDVVVVDDLVATASSIMEAAQVLREQGARDIYAAITHPILSGPAIERIHQSAFKEVLVTDTVFLPKEKHHPRIKVLSVAELLGEAIRRIHFEESVSSLFV